MAFCKVPAHWGRWLLFIIITVGFQAAHAFDFQDSLRTEKLPNALIADISSTTKGAITPSADGVLLSTELPHHVLLKFDNQIPGSDEHPLLASVHIRIAGPIDGPMAPGFYFYWDDKNYTYFRPTHDAHVFYGMVNKGEEISAYEPNVMRESRTVDAKLTGKDIYVRMLLVDKNLAYFVSSDGVNWREIANTGVRPGAAGVAPKILFGRGIAGAKPALGNDVESNPKEFKPLTKVYYSEVSIADHGASTQIEVPTIDKKESWDATLAALEPAGIPRTWQVLGPAGDKTFHETKDWLTNENWATIKDLGGKPVKYSSFTKPDDEAEDPLVDLRDRVERAKNSTILCRTDVEWPVAGEAMLWFDYVEPCRIWVNNKLAFDYAGNEWWRERHPVKDRRAIPIWLDKGKNSVKIVFRSTHGEASFFFRMERDDVAYRLGLTQKMLEYFPPPTGGWRAEQALFEQARAREDAFDFKGALASYTTAANTLVNSAESQSRAFEGKLRIYAFLRLFDEAIKTADAFIAAHPADRNTMSARRAALRYETLAGRVGPARDRAHKWGAKGGPVEGAEPLRIVAGALAEAGSRNEHLATLDEIANTNEFKPEDRARGMIESACWRIEYERRKGAKGVQPDPVEQERACKSMLAAVALLPGSKNPVAVQFVGDAQAELNAKKPDRAYGASWAATLTALLCSDPDSAYYFAATKTYPIELPLKDKNNAIIADQNQFREAAWSLLREKCGDAVWVSKWRFVAFQRSRDGKANPDINGPQTNADPGARYGDRGWNEFEPEADKTERGEMGFDVKKFSGDGQVVYLMRDFELKNTADTLLQLSNSGGWDAWLDGKLVGRDLSNDTYKIEADRIPVHIEKGRHRLLIRLEPPAEGAYLFRARIGPEPQLAMMLYVNSLMARNFPVSMADRAGDLNYFRDVLRDRSNPASILALAQTVCLMYDDQKWFALDQMTWAAQILHDANRDAESMQALREALKRLDDGPDYQGRSKKILEVSRALARALVHSGEFAAGDLVLSDAINRFPEPVQDSALSIAWRGTLRWELGMSQAALPFFERCAHMGKLPDEARPIVNPGLEWAKYTRPERITVDNSHEVQSLLDAVRRQLNGAPDDIDKAMHGLSDILANTNNSLVKVSETPFAVRYVGVREFIRAMLEAMTPEQRAVYRKVVGEAAAQRLLRVATNDPVELERAALEFPYTLEAQSALSRAGDLYFDRGRYAQAASIYSTFLRESQRAEASALACAKLALAQAFDGQKTESEAALKRLETEFSKTQVMVRGAALSGAQLSERLRKQITELKAGLAGSDAGALAFMGGLARTGATHGAMPEPGGTAWVQPSIASGALDQAKSTFGVDSKAHLQSVPVTDGKRVYVGAMESLRAMDLDSGRILWTQTWAGAQSGMYGVGSGVFNGFPCSVPLVDGEKIVIRAQSLSSSLKCFDATTGTLKWSSDTQPSMKKFVWISDPSAAYGMIFAMYIEPGDFNVHGAAALDAETGRLRWKTELVSGATGIKIGASYYQASNHMGPPAIDAGELYVETGLASVAAINAFTGEARWIASYPRVQIGEIRRGYTGQFDLTTRSFKTFSRGPLSPMVQGTLIAVSPHDGNGVMAFNRRDGSLLWHRDMLDCRYVAGIAGGNILACDDGVTALNVETGATVWSLDLSGQGLQGMPAISGSQLYMPMRAGLLRVNALDGTSIGTAPWDVRMGPIANLLVTPQRIVGVSDRAVVAIGAGQSSAQPLPYYEGKRLEAEGKLDEAAQRYAEAESGDKDGLPQALIARIRVLKRQDKRDDALKEIARFEHDAPEKLSAMGGLWTTTREAIVRSLRAQFGEKSGEAPKNDGAKGLSGVLAYSLFLPGENPQMARFRNDPWNRIYVRLNGDVKCLSLGENSETIWSAYVGTQVKILATGDNFLVAVSDREITVLDRDTGEIVSQIVIANTEAPPTKLKHAAFKKRSTTQGESFMQAIVLHGVIYAATDTRLGAWDAVTGKLLWERAVEISRFTENELVGHDAVLQRIFQHREDIAVTSYDCATGAELQTLPVDKQQHIVYSADNHYMVGRFNNRLTCIDLFKMTVMWRKDIEELDVNNSTLEIMEGNQIRYAGPDKHNANHEVLRTLDLMNGNDVPPAAVNSPGVQTGTGLFVVAEHGYKLSRVKAGPNNTVEPVWTAKLPPQRGADYTFTEAFLSGPFFHGIFLRNLDNGSRDQMTLRTLAWETGQRISEQALPGTPLTSINIYNNAKTVRSEFMEANGTLIYTAKEGVFLFRPEGPTPSQAFEKLKTDLRQGGLPPARIKQVRRGAMGLVAPEALAFITPDGARADGDLAEWTGTDPITLANVEDYVPLVDDAKWPGAGAFSARIYTGWNREGVMIAIDVTDSTPAYPRPGSEMTTGDRVRVAIDARDGENATLDPSECFVGTLALAQSGSFFTQESGVTPENGPFAEGKVATSASGQGRLYELFVPWSALHKNASEPIGENQELRVGVAIFDGDASGTRGALEWGAGTSLPLPIPLWFGKLSMIDVSAEKVERYRKVIALVPGSPEAMKFLKLILVGKRGPKAEAERIAELEKFVIEHPDSANTPKALGMLRESYRRTNDPDAARLEKLIKQAKVPDTVRAALDAAVKIWVFPDPKKPPQMIMVQFSNGDFNNGVSRAYWGSPVAALGRDGTDSMKRIGDLPKLNAWTELSVSPYDLDLENRDIKVVALTSAGGLTYFDRLSYSVGGKETVLLEGRLPDKWQVSNSKIKFVDQPKRAAANSLTYDNAIPNDGLYDMRFIREWQPLINFSTLRPVEAPVKNPTQYQEVLRKVARIIDDTPDGLAFLRKAIEMNVGDEKQKSALALAEMRDFLKQSSGSTNAYEALKLAYYYYERSGEAKPMDKMAEFIRDSKVPISAVRAFYADRAPSWQEWNVIGPFVALGERRGMESSMEPERAVDLSFKTQNSGRELQWKKISAKNKNNDPIVDLRALLGAEKEGQRGPYFGYAYTKFNCPTKRKVLLAFGAEDVISIWVNGKRVVNEVYTWVQRDKEYAEVQLRSGENEILIKVGVQRDRLAFVFRLADLDGKPFDDITNE